MEDLHSNANAKQLAASPSQQFVDVVEVKEDTMILKSGALRSVLAVSAINYDLKSSEEQDAIISQYQNFLNSIDFPLQILIKSRKLNIDKYVDFITSKEKQQSNELLRLQISEYKSFIQQMVSISNIVDKAFYIVVPFSPIENKESGFLANLANILNPKKGIIAKNEAFETYRSQLIQRVDHIIAGLSGIGLRIKPLQTQELIELLYDSYNPTASDDSNLSAVEKLDIQ
jgi:hypothetical protein